MGIIHFSQVFALHVTGSLNAVLSIEHRREICRYIYNHQACQRKFQLFAYQMCISILCFYRKFDNTVSNVIHVE